MKEDIVNIAIYQLEKTVGLTATWKRNVPLDGILVFKIEGDNIPFTAYIRTELRQYQLYELQKLQERYKNLIIVAENIFPKIKEELRACKIAYLETNGNVFLTGKGVYYFIDTNKNSINQPIKANRAFTKTGLKVIFQLLLNKELVNKPQREIAKITEVALGNIPQVINGLKATGYLLPLNNKEYVWENTIDLLDKWINKYATELRPKLIRNNYKYQGNWKEIKLNNELTVWGGEPAADIITNHLRPEKYVIYTKENQVNLMKNYHFVPDKDGEIEVLDMFWNNTSKKNTAPPLLVYAELRLEGGKRNNETALKIFNEYIKPNL